MNVKELAQHLQTGNQEAEVVCMDYFGSPVPLTKDDFNFRDGYLVVTAVDIGPEPE